MIKINLVPSAVSAGKADDPVAIDIGGEGSEEIKRKGLVNIFIMLLLPIALYVYGAQAKPQKIAELNNIRAQIDELHQYNEKYKDITAEIEQIKKDEQSVQERITALNEVTLGRTAEVRVMDLIQSVIRERMWLRRLEITDGKVQIEGISQSEIETNALLDDLTKNVIFSPAAPPRLLGTDQEIIDGQTYSKFRIEAGLEKRK